MNILLVLIPVTGLIVLVAVALFFWAANHQQFDDLDSPAVLPLMEDEPAPGEAAPPQEPPSTGNPGPTRPGPDRATRSSTRSRATPPR